MYDESCAARSGLGMVSADEIEWSAEETPGNLLCDWETPDRLARRISDCAAGEGCRLHSSIPTTPVKTFSSRMCS